MCSVCKDGEYVMDIQRCKVCGRQGVIGRLPTKRQMRVFAEWLNEVHRNDPGTVCSADGWKREYKGLLGQWRFAYLTGGRVDMERKRRGDGGIDAWVDFRGDGDEHPPGRYGVDVKAAANPACLMTPLYTMRKIKDGTILVLAGITKIGDQEDENDWINWDAELMGWEWAETLRAAKVGDRGGHGVISCYLDESHPVSPRGRDIYELLAKIERQWGSVKVM